MVEREQLISIVQAVQQGEEGAATKLYNTFYHNIFCCVMDTVNDPELAADLTQNAFMEIFTTIGKLEEPAAFVVWSKQIAYHCCTAYYRKRSDLLADEIEDHSALDTIEERREDFIPGETLDKEALKRTIRDMIETLPPEQRSAIMMRYFEEIPVKEIARIQGVTEGTVKSRLHYGRQAIRQSVEEYEKKHDIKLHSTGVIPLLLWLFREYKAVNGLPLTANVTSAAFAAGAATGAAASSAAVTATTSASAGTTLVTKLIAGFTVVAIAVGGVTATVVTVADHTDRFAPKSTAESQASELSLVLSSDGTHYEVRSVGALAASEIVIPSEYEGLPVTAISPYAFMDCSNIVSITTVVVESGVTTIRHSAFYECNNLISVTLPDTITEIGTEAFASCPALTTVNGPGHIDNVATGAFSKSTALPADENGLIVMYDILVAYKGSDEVPVIPENVKRIGSSAFAENQTITGVTLHEGVTTIGWHAFENCVSLGDVQFPDGLTLIDESAFYGCESLKTVTIPASVTEIKSFVFAESGLTYAEFAGGGT